MPIDPQAQAVLDLIADDPPFQQLSPQEARKIALARRRVSGRPERVVRVVNRTIAGPGGALHIRLYYPKGTGPLPALLYFHGGGWVIGGIATVDATCRALANMAGCVVASVEYRLAPEHKFPAALDDAVAATAWVAREAADLGIDGARVAVGGDSAGANLAAVVAITARNDGWSPLVAQLLVYPVMERRFDTGSYRENGDAYYLTRDLMAWFWGHYLRDEADAANPRAAPLLTPDLSGLPPAFIVTAEYDPLRDEGEHYAVRLREAGVDVTCMRYPGMIHGFFTMVPPMDVAKRCHVEAAAALREAFGLPPSARS